MLDIKKWKRIDIVYAILSISISAVLVSVVLIQQQGLLGKTIMFLIISVLIYFVLKYIQEYNFTKNKENSKNTSTNNQQLLEELNIPHEELNKESEEESILESFSSTQNSGSSSGATSSSSSGATSGNISSNTYNTTNSDTGSTAYNTTQNNPSGINTSLGLTSEEVENTQINNSIYRDTKQESILGEEYRYQEEEHHRQEEEHHRQEEEHHRQEEEYHRQEEEYHRQEEEYHRQEEEHHYQEEESHQEEESIIPEMTKSQPQKLTQSRTYGTSERPININVSYNTRNSTNTDDVITIRERFGKPDQSDYIFNTPTAETPETTDMKLNTTTPTQSQIQSNNNQLSQTNSNNKYYSPPDSKCNGSACSPQPRNNNVYSGTNYEYINADVPPNNFENCISNKKSEDVCPLSINQNWSKWNPQYLTGDDSNSNMLN